jgi:hypothetical protein
MMRQGGQTADLSANAAASAFGKLDKALDEANAKDWILVDMKTDWKTVFPPVQ